MIRLIILWLLFVKYRITHRKINYKGFSIICSLSGGRIAIGGGCPRTTDHKSEILQSVSSSDDSCLSYGNNYQLLGGNTSNPSSATYNLKVENSQN